MFFKFLNFPFYFSYKGPTSYARNTSSERHDNWTKSVICCFLYYYYYLYKETVDGLITKWANLQRQEITNRYCKQ